MLQTKGIWFIVFVVAATLVVVIAVQQSSSPSPTNNTSEATDSNQTNTTEVAEQEALDETTVSADGKYTLLKEMTTTTIGEITSYQFSNGNALSVMPEAMKSAVLNETPVVAEQSTQIGDVPAMQYTLSSAKDGSHFTVVQVVRAGQLYDFRGSEEYLANLADYIKFN